MSRGEIIAAVRAHKTAIFWFTNRGMIVCAPGQEELVTIADVGPEFLDAEILAAMPPEPIVVKGTAGLAATDPYWDGSDTFKCPNPACGIVHSMDDNVHENLWKRRG